MAEDLPKVDRALLNTLVRGAEKTFANAESLYREAEILAKAGATATWAAYSYIPRIAPALLLWG